MKNRIHMLCLLGLFFLVACFGCGNKRSELDVPFKRAFYFWKTSYYTSLQQDSLIAQLNINTLYTKMFEVDWDEYKQDVVPIGEFNYSNSDDFFYYDSLEYIPVVYITNESFLHINDSQVVQLAFRVVKKIQNSINEAALAKVNNSYYYKRYNEPGNEYFYSDDNPYRLKSRNFDEMHVIDSIRSSINKNIKEYQFDCDWTNETRSKYFLFLSEIKKHLKNKIISSTIRLYQYKYFDKTGVPPVDKGMLMCYNAGDVRKMDGPNSIFDKREILKYLNSKMEYPLILDYALPVFEWVAVYRNNEIIYLLPPEHFMLSNIDLYKRQESVDEETERYLVLSEHSIGYDEDQIILKTNDIVKLESPILDDVAALSSKLKAINKNPNPIISLFDFDLKYVKKNEKQINEIFDSF